MYGTPDFIGEYRGVPVVLDFKTSRLPYDKNLIKRDEQLYIYAWLAQKCLGFTAKELQYVVLCKKDLRIQTSVNLVLTDDKLKSMLDNIVIMVKDLKTRSEFPKNRKNCLYCPYPDLCYPGEAYGSK